MRPELDIEQIKAILAASALVTSCRREETFSRVILLPLAASTTSVTLATLAMSGK